MDIARRRLAAQHLVAPRLTKPADVVRTLGAVQSQDYAGAKWALAMRMRDATDVAIERDFTEGAILRTHVLRPTWHFVAPSDIRWMLALTGPRVKATMSSYDRKLELDDALYRRTNVAIARATRDGKHLTRAEVGQALQRARIDVGGSQRLSHIMLRAELDGLVCSGPRRGKQFTYALLDERVPPMPSLGRDEALLELTRRYFSTRSPATANDFAWWSGLTVGDAKRGIEIAALEREVIEDRTYWSDSAVEVSTAKSPTVHLLPNYDEYFIGFKDRSAIARRLSSGELVTGGDALVVHIVVVDGQLVGGWKRTVTKTTVLVDMHLLTRLSGSERRVMTKEVERYAEFVGLAAELQIASPASSVSRRARSRSKKR